MERDDKKAEEIAGSILNYLQSHPKAADSLEGVMRWWLDLDGNNREQRLVIKALDILQNEGRIHKRLLTDGTELYWSSPERNEK